MTTSALIRPEPIEYAAFYRGYVELVPEGDILEILAREGEESAAFFESIPEAMTLFRYAPGKWSVKQVLNHVSDAERVFAYRALRFGRRDTTPLPGFDENDYAEHAPSDARPWDDLVAEFRHVRRATVSLFQSFTPEDVLRRGSASGAEVSVRALAYITAGHALHHVQMIRERYLRIPASS